MGPLREALLGWYGAHRRDLPWRRRDDPYAVWVSEAMLQQTRVEAVREPYERFLARFPTLERLAEASEDEVVAAWSGLGYYRRARALRRAARAVVERHGGRFPADREAALALPGVGPYTAGAVLSIALGAAVPAVDGNVARVVARLLALEASIGSTALARRVDAVAAALVPPAGRGPGGPGAWNQALMELGATVCVPRAPRCDACPVAAWCAARAAGRETELPVPAPRPAPVDVALELALVVEEERVLLARRPATGRMAGMWEPPTRELRGPGLWPADLPAGVAVGRELGALSHAITRHRIRATLREGRLAGGAPAADAPGAPAPPGGLEWVRRARLPELALTGLARKALGLARPRPGRAARVGDSGGGRIGSARRWA